MTGRKRENKEKPQRERAAKNEAVTATFHYFERDGTKSSGGTKPSPLNNADLDAIYNAIKHAPKPNYHDKEEFLKVKHGEVVPFGDPVRVDDRTIFGTYEGVYYGHKYNNTEKGSISADSLNLRQFCYLIYLEDSGRLYVGVQYLGNYGQYEPIRRTIQKALPNKSNVQSFSFRDDSALLEGAVPKRVEVSVSRRGDSATSGNRFTESGVVVFKANAGDPEAANEMKRTLLGIGQTIDEAAEKKAQRIANALSGKLIDINDAEIEHCKLVVDVEGRQKTIYILGGANYATNFELDVEKNPDGLPKLDQTKAEMIKKLRQKIIDRKEDA